MTFSYFLIHNVSGITSGRIKKKAEKKCLNAADKRSNFTRFSRGYPAKAAGR